jgi:hypothetical protein
MANQSFSSGVDIRRRSWRALYSVSPEPRIFGT